MDTQTTIVIVESVLLIITSIALMIMSYCYSWKFRKAEHFKSINNVDKKIINRLYGNINKLEIDNRYLQEQLKEVMVDNSFDFRK